MKEPAFVMVSSMVGIALHPVHVLSRGEKFSRVRWLRAGCGKQFHKRGDTERVPTHALCGPVRGAWYSVGRNQLSRPAWKLFRPWLNQYLSKIGADFVLAYWRRGRPTNKRVLF